jgi:FkbH-like protein
LFDTLAFSEEDRGRAGMYAADRKRREIQDSTGSFEEYLATLGVEVDIDVVRDADVARVSQLTQKTNQFNLTTQRRSEADIAAMVGAGDVVLLRVKARDRIAELGLIGVAALRIEAGEGEITDFLMSCRALGRGIETALLARLVADGRSGGASRIVGVYKKTAKNTLCADFYRQASFACYDADAGRWALSAGDAAPATPTWIKLAGTANVG